MNVIDPRSGCQALCVFVICIVMTACAGELKDPNRFGQSTTTGRDGGTLDGTVTSTAPPSCAVDVEMDVIAVTCGKAGCHSTMSPVSGLDLESPGLAARVLDINETGSCGRPLISTSTPSESAIVDRLKPQPNCGLAMPIGTALTPDERACIEFWIIDIVRTATEARGD